METDRWLRLGIPLAGRDPAEQRMLTATLLALGGAAVREEDGRLRTHVPEPPAPAGFLREARRRLVVVPVGTSPELADDELALRLDPGMAFGTAEHGTTRGMLRLTETAVSPGDRVLDVGTGSGILSLAAVLLGAERVVAVDVDAGALEVARHNLERNGAAGPVDLLRAEATPALLSLLEPLRFEVILANILAPVLRPLLVSFRRLSRPAGRLILGGILEREAEGMREAAREAGWRVREEDRDDGWWTVRLTRAGD